MLALSVIGVVDSFYLTITHFTNKALVCTILEGCDVVLKSAYSSIGPVPTAALGIFFYIVVFYGVLLALSGREGAVSSGIFALWIIGGFSASILFLYLQAFVIGAYCQYCLLSLITSTLLFVLVFLMRGSVKYSTFDSSVKSRVPDRIDR